MTSNHYRLNKAGDEWEFIARVHPPLPPVSIAPMPAPRPPLWFPIIVFFVLGVLPFAGVLLWPWR